MEIESAFTLQPLNGCLRPRERLDVGGLAVFRVHPDKNGGEFPDAIGDQRQEFTFMGPVTNPETPLWSIEQLGNRFLVLHQGSVEMAVAGEPRQEPVELRPRTLSPKELVNVDPQFAAEIVFNGLAVLL